MTRISIADPDVGTPEINRVTNVMETGQIADGPEVRRFESEFADYCGASEAIATANGTTALHAALTAAGIGEGDRVLTTPFTFIASVNAIRLSGATPVFADIDPATFNLDPDAVADTLDETDSINAILAVHLYGLPAPMDELSTLAAAHDATLIEDAAQAHGAKLHGNHVGSLGDIAAFSFYPTKNMTTAEGGMVTTDDDALAARVRSFINHGRAAANDTDETGPNRSYAHARIGHNFRMTSIAAAIGRAQLEKLPAYITDRRQTAARYTDTLETVSGITPPADPPGYRHSYHQYTIRCEDRESLKTALDAAGIDTAVYYPTPIHEQPPYSDMNGTYPHAERASNDVLSIPVHPQLDEEAIIHVADTLGGIDL